MSNRLAVCISDLPVAHFLADGRPVFPMCTPAQEQSLRQVAELHAASLEVVEAAELPAPPVSRTGVVVAFGQSCADAGRLHAELTGRRWVVVDDVDALSRIADVSVLVLTADRLAGRVLQHLYVERRDGVAAAPGLLVAPDQETLLIVVLRAAAALQLSGRAANGRTFLFPRDDFDQQRQGNDLFLGSLAPDTDVDDALGTGSAILSIQSHSNGFDTWIGENRLLCPFAQSLSVANQEEAPLCAENHRCSRFPSYPSIDSLRHKGWLVPLSAPRARILLAYSCGILKVTEDLIHPRHSLGLQLSLNAHLGALITTWHTERDDPTRTALNGLINALSRGVPVGEAVASFAATPLARHYATSLCVLGDPDYRIAPMEQAPPLPEPVWQSRDWRPIPVEGSPAPRARQLIDGIRVALDDGANLPAERVTSCVEALTLVATSPNPTPADIASASRAAADLIARWPWLDDFLASKGRLGPSEDRHRCGSCGAPARRYEVAFDPSLEVAHRAVLDCTSCGEIRNLPAGSALRLDGRRLSEGRLALLGVPPDAVASVSYLSFEYSASLTLPWPEQDGRLVESIDVPAVLPAGPILCKIVVSWGLEVALVGARFRRTRDGGLILPARASHAETAVAEDILSQGGPATDG